MRFLLDANLSPRLREALTAAGYQLRHVVDIGLVGASDNEIFDRAAADGDVVITADSDFSMLLASRQAVGPSVILLRHVAELPGPHTSHYSRPTWPPFRPTSTPVQWCL